MWDYVPTMARCPFARTKDRETKTDVPLKCILYICICIIFVEGYNSSTKNFVCQIILPYELFARC